VVNARRPAVGPLRVQLDRTDPVPLYHQLARQLEAEITAGVLPPGARLDNEIVLAAALGVSRPTMRRALQQLVEKGLLVRRRGVGTQVVHAAVSRPLELTSLYEDLARNGQHPTTRVLLCESTDATDEVAAALGVAVGQPVLHLRRLRGAEAEPLALLENYLPADIGQLDPDELGRNGLYEVLSQRGVTVRVARQQIGARTGTAQECRLLGERRNCPLVTIERTGHDGSGRVVEWGRHAYRASRYSFEVTLIRRGTLG